MRIFKAHIIGIELGGFLALHIASFKQLSTEISSLTIISSYMNPTLFQRKSGVFFKPSGKAIIISDLTDNQFPPHLRPGAQFLRRLVEEFPVSLANCRISLRNESPPAPVPSLPDGAVLVVQSLDFSYKLQDNAVPHKVIKGAKVALLKKGGIFPHLIVPSDLLVYVNLHLSKWHSPSPNLKLDSTPEEDQNK